MFRILFIILFALSFSHAAWADEPDPKAIPEKIQRNWAFPDCGHYDNAVIFTRYFYVRASKKEITLLPYEIVKGGSDYSMIRADEGRSGDDVPVRIENDGILKIGLPDKDSPKKPKKWDDYSFDQKPEYSACGTVPTVVPKAMTRLLRYIDRVQDQCTLKIDNDCARVMFKLADENSDKKLTAAEIRKATLSALLLAELGDRKTLNDKDLKAIAARAKDQGDLIADDLMTRFDKDKSKTLDFNELGDHFSPPRLPIIKEMLMKAGKLIPVFQMAGATLD